jgi:hypothetical protein
MEDYSFLNDVNSRLDDFLVKHEFSLHKPSSQITVGFEDKLLSFVSPRCQLRIFVEHYRIYVDISALDVKDPNLWYNFEAMACFVSSTLPSQWIYDLPRGIPLRQVMDQQLTRWQGILEKYFDQIVPLFISPDKLNEKRQTLDAFVRSYYAEQQKALSQKAKLEQNKNA